VQQSHLQQGGVAMSRQTLRVWSILTILALTASTGVSAQDRPVVFLHGLNSDSAGWQGVADRLRARASITSYTPTVNWRAAYGSQVDELMSREYATLPGTAMAIGHSNGGIVGREWAKRGGLAGVITIGTPHRGAPIVPNYGHWVAFNVNASWLSSSILTAFSRWTEWTWALGYVNEAIGWALDFSVWSTVFLAMTIGLDHGIPVFSEMHPYSLFLHNLNAPGSIDHERAMAPVRIGIVSIAHNYYWAGPARIVAPDHADGIATALYGAAYGLFYWGNYILASAAISDLDAIEQAMTLLALSNHLLALDPTYCALVSSMDVSTCVASDGIVPYTSQEYPQAPNLYLGQHNDGPVHTRERQESEDVLYYALVNIAGIPPRGAAPPPGGDPPPSGTGGGDTPGDGGGGGCATGGWPAALSTDQVLWPDHQLSSTSGCYHVVYQSDGNLVLYDALGAPLWATGTHGTSPGAAIMQSDGNFVVYDADWVPRWASGTAGHHGAQLVLQTDGNLVLYEATGEALWASGTAR
jgi:pimeloyl-ACP methyl ester carboxylesterase